MSRSSNSPRYFAPAISAPRSRATTRFSRRPSGTSPRTIRWASPSAIAVLPTPGSPMRTGLFFVRRLSTWMTRRISSSRPMTGSSAPFSGGLGQVAAVLLEGLVGRLGILARHALAPSDLGERLQHRCGLDAERRAGCWPRSCRRPRSSPAGGAPSKRTRPACARPPHAHRSGRVAPRSRGAAAGPPRTPSAASPARRAAPAATVPGATPMRSRTAGTTPSGCSARMRSRWATSSCACPSASASCCAATIASVARWVNRSVRIGLAPVCAWVRLLVCGQDRLELLAGLLVELRQHDAGGDEQVALLRRAALRQPATLDA